VKRGDVLFRIDPAPFEFEVERLRAELADVLRSTAQVVQ
jgi:multidrug resistance efflux pump